MTFNPRVPMPAFAAAGILLVCAAGCGPSGGGGASGKGARAPLPSVAVQLGVAEARPVERTVVAFGTLGAMDQSSLAMKVPGRVRRVAVDLGSVVRAGDVLVEIEPEESEAKLRQAGALLTQAEARLGLESGGEVIEIDSSSQAKEAQAVLDEAMRNLDRVKRLAEQKIASEADLSSAEAAYQVALNRLQDAREETRTRLALLQQRRAELDIARQQLRETTLRAPFDGVIESRLANLGELINAGVPVLRLVRMDPLRLRLEIPERDAGQIEKAQAVRVTVEGDTNTYHGSLARLSPVISDRSRMLSVEADVPNPGGLRPGQFARASIVVLKQAPAVTVPVDAVRSFAGAEKLFTVRDGKAVERILTIGQRAPEWIEVLDGVKAGEPVVRNPGGLQNGQPVTLLDPSTAAGPRGDRKGSN